MAVPPGSLAVLRSRLYPCTTSAAAGIVVDCISSSRFLLLRLLLSVTSTSGAGSGLARGAVTGAAEIGG